MFHIVGLEFLDDAKTREALKQETPLGSVKDGSTGVDGFVTSHGVTRPLTLTQKAALRTDQLEAVVATR